MKFNPTWDFLRVIGKSKIVGLTSLIPFIGYLLLFNDTIVQYISMSPTLIGSAADVSVSISRLYYIYFGLTFLGFSSIFYTFYCPKEIKEFSSEHEHSEKEINIMTSARLKSLYSKYEIAYSKNPQALADLKEHLDDYNSAYRRAGTAEGGKENQNNAILDILRFHWSYVNNERLVVRILISVGYFFGFILLLIPSCMVFFSVINNLLSKI